MSTAVNVTTINDALENIKTKQNNGNFMLLINENIKTIYKYNLDSLKEFLDDHQIITFQSSADGKFCIIWKIQDEIFILYILDNIKKSKLNDLCNFLIDFLTNCLNEDHSGILSTEISKVNKFNIPLTSLGDIHDLDLLFYAAENGKSKIVQILLDINFNVNSVKDRKLPIDFAYENQNFETVLILLKENSYFPYGFKAENCPDDIKEFAKMCDTFHEHIEKNNLEEISEMLSQNTSLRYFFSSGNFTAVAKAYQLKKFEVYEILVSKNMFFSPFEDIEDFTGDYNEDELKIVRDINFKYKKNLPEEKHLNVLMFKIFVGHDEIDLQENLNHVMRAFRALNKFPSIRILFQIAAHLKDLKITFDFKHNSVLYLDPSKDRTTFGTTYLSGRILVGAKQLKNPHKEHEAFATIAHELCHYINYIVFKNDTKPYEKNDKETEIEFEAISEQCKTKDKADKIVKDVYDYPPEEHHAELIVRIPHFYAHYFNDSEMIENLKIDFQSLFDFYETKLMSKFEIEFKMLEKKAENELKAKDKKISILIIALIAVFFTLSSIAIFVGLHFYKPTYVCTELNDDLRGQVVQANVTFEGILLKFSDLYSENFTNEICDVLNSEQITKLIEGEILDISSLNNSLLETKINLIYGNLTENLKLKVQNSSINFQNESIEIKSLLRNQTENFLSSLNSKEILDLLKNKSSIKFDEKFTKNSTSDIFIERTFYDLSLQRSNYYHLVKNNYSFYSKTLRKISITSKELIKKSFDQKFILLSDHAGNGKTTIFIRLSIEIKEENILKFVKYVDLKAHIPVYNQFNQTNFEVIELLAKIFDLNEINSRIFEILYNAGQIIFLWDGFDEISRTYTELILNLMSKIKKESQNIQFVSTRPQYAQNITDVIRCQKFSLFPYLKEENDEFLVKFYKSKNINQTEALKKAKNLIQKVASEKDDEFDFVKSPLLLKMIAEVSLDTHNSLNTTNLYTIYESFIDIKLNISEDKKDVVKNDLLKLKKKSYSFREINQYFAILAESNSFKVQRKTFNNLSIIEDFENSDSIIDELSREGILIFSYEKKIDFTHRTFMEFFIAQYIIDKIYKMRKSVNEIEIENRVEFFIYHIRNYDILRFLESYLEINEINIKNEKLIKIAGEEFNKLLLLRFSDPLQFLNLIFQFFPSTVAIEIALEYDKNTTFLSRLATLYPNNFLKIFYDVEKILIKNFPNDSKKREKFFLGQNQRGNFILGAFINILKKNIDKKDLEKFLNFTKIDFDIKNFYNFENISSFYDFIHSNLTSEEIHELLVTNFHEILYFDGVQMWKIFKEKLTVEKIQELILSGPKNGEGTLIYAQNFEVTKLLFKELEGTTDSRFMNFLLDSDNTLQVDEASMMADDNFEIFCKMIKNRSQEEIQKILKSLSTMQSYSLFGMAVSYGTVEKFEEVKNFYGKFLNETEMQNICRIYLYMINMHYTIRWKPQNETKNCFADYLKTLNFQGKIKDKLEYELKRLYRLYKIVQIEETFDNFPLDSLIDVMKSGNFSKMDRVTKIFNEYDYF